MTENRSTLEIQKWYKLYQSYKNKGKIREFKQRLNSYKASLILGREFQESVESYLKRKNLEEFWNWEPEEFNNKELKNTVTTGEF